MPQIGAVPMAIVHHRIKAGPSYLRVTSEPAVPPLRAYLLSSSEPGGQDYIICVRYLVLNYMYDNLKHLFKTATITAKKSNDFDPTCNQFFWLFVLCNCTIQMEGEHKLHASIAPSWQSVAKYKNKSDSPGNLAMRIPCCFPQDQNTGDSAVLNPGSKL